MSLEKQVARRMGGSLDDEEVRHAAVAFRLGGAREFVAESFRAGGGMVVSAMITRSGMDKAVVPPGPLLPLPQKCIVALTSARLLFFGNKTMVNGPTDLLHEVALQDVLWVGEPDTQGRLIKAMRVVVGLRSDQCLGWEFPRISLKTGAELLAELKARVATG